MALRDEDLQRLIIAARHIADLSADRFWALVHVAEAMAEHAHADKNETPLPSATDEEIARSRKHLQGILGRRNKPRE